MAGDEIVADWLGDTYITRIQVVNTVTCFSASSKRFRSLYIYNDDGAKNCYVGQYNGSIATFIQYAHILEPQKSVRYEFIDLHELGCYHGTNVFYLKVLGINEY